jgi:signal transduction histidine kinase
LLQSVADLAVPTLADGCVLESRVEDGYRAGACKHSDPVIDELLQKVCAAGVRRPPADNPLTEILQSRSPVLLQSGAGERIADVSSNSAYIVALRAMGPHAALFLPLIARGQMIGVLSLFRGSRGFDGDDLAFAEDLGRLAALALDNSRLLDAVRSSLRAREEIVGVVSHDLRNPVAAVKMLGRALLDADSEGESGHAKESLSLIVEAAEQMDGLIRDLLDVNQLDAGKLTIAPELTDVTLILTDSLRTIRPLTADKGIAIDVQIEVGLPKVFADVERVQQVLSNLVGNAIKFTPFSGKIVIAAKRNDDDVVISVADTGAGIAGDELPKVFDRYWQSTRTNRQGAGLGLAIAKGIVESHAGRIWLESEPGVGTTVRFSLPTSAVTARARTQS